MKYAALTLNDNETFRLFGGLNYKNNMPQFKISCYCFLNIHILAVRFTSLTKLQKL